MSSYGYGSTTPTEIAVPAEFTLVPSLVDLLNTLDQVEHPRCTIAEPVNPFVAQPPKVVPAEALRAHLVSWHNQLVTVQGKRIQSEHRATEQQKAADSYRRELETAKARVAELREALDLSHKAQATLQLDADSLTAQNESLTALLEEARAELALQKPSMEMLARIQEERVTKIRKAAGLKSTSNRKAVKR
jgi:hypothetical protein